MGHRDTREEALANISGAKELSIEACIDDGGPVPKKMGGEFMELEAGTSWAIGANAI